MAMNTISTREKMGTLIKRFLRLLDDNKNKIFNLSNLIAEACGVFKDNKKAMDMVFYFESLGLLIRISIDHIVYVGYKGMTRKLYEYENDLPVCRPPKLAQEVPFLGKLVSIRSHNLASNLLGKIFFTLIYKKQSIMKSSVEEMAENAMAQHKELNYKNYVPDILNLLNTLNLVERNDSTQLITYVGPDLRIYDQNDRKISWKIYEIMRREEIALGKEITMPVQTKPEAVKGLTTNNPMPNSLHISYFPELSYAVLRAQNWEKYIAKTIFFIGRNQKSENKSRKYQVDLQLPYKSVSRQHAVILYNFDAARWEIRCLSKKNLIKVDDERFGWGDHNIWLKNKSEIRIGPEKMVFVEAVKNN